MPLAVDGSGDAALQRRLALAGTSTGLTALFQNLRVVGIACFACLGGLLYGYNQGVFSGMVICILDPTLMPLGAFPRERCRRKALS